MLASFGIGYTFLVLTLSTRMYQGVLQLPPEDWQLRLAGGVLLTFVTMSVLFVLFELATNPRTWS